MRYIIYVCLIISQVVDAQQLSIGLFRNSQVNQIDIQAKRNTTMKADNFVFHIGGQQTFGIKAVGSEIEINTPNGKLGRYQKIFVGVNRQEFSIIEIDCVYPDLKPLEFVGEIKITAQSGLLKLVNTTDEDNYLAGVLKGEAGKDKPVAFYDAMAVMARTYMRFYSGRHQKEGFSLCDQTHCQVYKGYSNYSAWYESARRTQSWVMMNPEMNQFTEAVFHSNCGGMTADAASVWKSGIQGYEVLSDPFCLGGKHAEWSKAVSLKDFQTVLRKQIGAIADRDSLCEAIYACHDGNRPSRLIFLGKEYSPVKMRSDFNLRSAWFDIECRSDSVIFTGKGYGHGVGLCQEGAINMAVQGYSGVEILRYYFRNVAIVHEKSRALIPDSGILDAQ